MSKIDKDKLPQICTNLNPLYAYRAIRGNHYSVLQLKEVKKLTGLSIRQLQHYERWGSSESHDGIDVCRVLSDTLGIKYSRLKNWRLGNHVPVVNKVERRINHKVPKTKVKRGRYERS